MGARQWPHLPALTMPVTAPARRTPGGHRVTPAVTTAGPFLMWHLGKPDTLPPPWQSCRNHCFKRNILCALQGARCCQPTAAVHETQLQCRWALTLQPACSGGCRHPSIMAQRDTHTPKCFPKAFKSSLWTLPRTPPRSRGSQPQLVGAFSTDAPSHPWNKCVLWAAPGSSCSPKAGRASGGTACPELPQKLGKNSHILSR